MNNLGKEFFIVDKQQVNKYNWTKEQINYIINTYLQDKKSQKVIADEFNVTQGTIRNILIKYRINLKSDNKKYEKDESFFEVIDTEEKAYWLGFLYADGYIVQTKEKSKIRLGIQSRDEEHLQKFLESLKSNYKICHSRKIMDGKEYYLSFVDIVSVKMVKDIIALGCTPCKTFTQIFPSDDIVPKKFQLAFIRGFFDGDGCITKTKDKYKKIDGTQRDNYRLFFMGTENMISHIKQILNLSSNRIYKEGKVYKVYVYGNKKTYQILSEYIYKDATIYLERKYKKFLELKNLISAP